MGDVRVRLGHEESENTLRGNGWYGVVCGLGMRGLMKGELISWQV